MYIVYRERDGILSPFTAFPFLSNATGSSLAAVPTVTREREREILVMVIMDSVGVGRGWATLEGKRK